MLSRGQSGNRLASAVRALRAGRPTATDHSCDPELVALVTAPYTDSEAVHRRLAELLAAFEARDDRRAVFLAIYSRMTAAVGRRIRRGEFADSAWVESYLVAFANRYRLAVLHYERGRHSALPDPWQIAFQDAAAGDSLVLQDAMLGVNAHINYDLSLALHEVGVGPDHERRYADHSAIIDIIADLVDKAQVTLAERDADGLATLDDSLGRADEWLTVAAIDQCRDSAWRTAVAMDSRLRLRRRLARWLNHTTATGAAYAIRSSRSSSHVHDALVTVEGSTE
jgi:hypothetical protein